MAMICTESEVAAKYFLCQYLGDTFRREPRNIGVIVEFDGKVIARFAGEGKDSEVDGRKLRWIKDLSAYSQWIKHWRKLISRPKWEQALIDSGKSNYYVLEGGIVAGLAGDDVADACEYLFSLLISEGGIDSLDDMFEEDKSSVELTSAFQAVLRREDLLGERSGTEWPVMRKQELFGPKRPWLFSFVQNGPRINRPIEVFDFDHSQETALDHHIGWAKQAFEDVRTVLGAKLDPCAVVQWPKRQSRMKMADNFKATMEGTATVYDWENRRQVDQLTKKLKSTAGFMF